MFRYGRRSWCFWIAGATAAAFAACVGSIFFFLICESAPIFAARGWFFVTGREWLVDEKYGALPMIYGSAMVTGLALLLALPFALGTAILTAEFLPSRLRLAAKAAMELLAGVPGIVYGLLGVSVLSVWVRDVFGLIDGNVILTAAILLAVMILPTIMTLAEDALRAVPGEYRDAALSLGLTRAAAVFRVALPRALPGIAGAVFLGLGRAMGETVAVMLVIGGLDRIPEPWYDVFAPAQSIPSKLGREAAETLGSGLHWHALMGIGLILFVMTMSVAFIGNRLLRRF
jgi:phosphate transport system permease protein